MNGAGAGARHLPRATTSWLDVRAASTLRGRVAPAHILWSAVLWTVLFLGHWEATLEAPPPDMAVLPMDRLPVAWGPWIGLLFACLFLLNGWWIDRWLARESGIEDEIRPSWRWFRRIVAGVPILAILLVSFWRWLIVYRPRWAISEQADRGRRLLLEDGEVSIHPGWPARARRWLRRRHEGLSPSHVFVIGHMLVGFFGLRFVVATLAEVENGTARFALALSVVALRGLGCALSVAYVRRRNRDRGKEGWAIWTQLFVVIGWLTPSRWAYLSIFFIPSFVNDRWDRWTDLIASERRGSSSEGGKLTETAPVWRWLALARSAADHGRSGHLGLRAARLVTFALMLELAMALAISHAGIHSSFRAVFALLGLPVIGIVLWIPVRAFLALIGELRRAMRPSERGAPDPGGVSRRLRLLFVPTLFGAGLCMVDLVAPGPPRGQGLAVLGCAALPMLGLVAGIRHVASLRGRRAPPLGLGWLLVFWLILNFGLVLEGKSIIKLTLWLWFFVALLAARLLVVREVGEMLYPFRISDATDPGLPARLRARLLGIVGATILPFGALAFPMVLEARGGLAAEFDRFWPFGESRHGSAR